MSLRSCPRTGRRNRRRTEREVHDGKRDSNGSLLTVAGTVLGTFSDEELTHPASDYTTDVVLSTGQTIPSHPFSLGGGQFEILADGGPELDEAEYAQADVTVSEGDRDASSSSTIQVNDASLDLTPADRVIVSDPAQGFNDTIATLTDNGPNDPNDLTVNATLDGVPITATLQSNGNGGFNLKADITAEQLAADDNPDPFIDATVTDEEGSTSSVTVPLDSNPADGMGTLTVTDARNAANTVAASDANAVEIYVLESNATSDAQLTLNLAPDPGVDASQYAYQIEPRRNTDASFAHFGNGAATVTLVADTTFDFTILAGIDQNDDNSLDGTTDQILRTINVHVVKLDYIEADQGTNAIATSYNGFGFSEDNTFAVVRGSAPMQFHGLGVTPDDPTTLSKIRWTVQQNEADAIQADVPDLDQDPNDPLHATLSTLAEGSFRVIAYFDANGNGAFDAGENLRVFNLAIVDVAVVDSSITHDDSVFKIAPITINPENVAGWQISAGTVAAPAVKFSAKVLLRGGGPNMMLGVDRIHTGIVQNGTALTFRADYNNGAYAKEELTAGSLPILDGPLWSGPFMATDAGTSEANPSGGPVPLHRRVRRSPRVFLRRPPR